MALTLIICMLYLIIRNPDFSLINLLKYKLQCFIIWKILRKAGAGVFISMVGAAAVADFMTYVVTAIQMTLNVVTANNASFVDAFVDFMSVYAVTQVPLAIIEGLILGMFAQYLSTTRPDVFEIADKNKINPFAKEE